MFIDLCLSLYFYFYVVCCFRYKIRYIFVLGKIKNVNLSLVLRGI